MNFFLRICTNLLQIYIIVVDLYTENWPWRELSTILYPISSTGYRRIEIDMQIADKVVGHAINLYSRAIAVKGSSRESQLFHFPQLIKNDKSLI